RPPRAYVPSPARRDDAVTFAASSRDWSRSVTASDDKTARIWDAATATEIAVLRGHDKAVNSAAFNRDGSHIVTASWDKTARIWDVASVRSGHADFPHPALGQDLTPSPTARRAQAQSGGQPRSTRTFAVLRGHHDAVWSA